MSCIIEADLVPVLVYHVIRVGRNPWERRYFIAPSRFENHVRALRAADYYLYSLTDFRAWATDQGELRANAVLLTFDDGYAGVSEHAYPLLRNKAIPLAAFVISSAIGATDAWMRNADPEHTAYPPVSRGQLEELARAGAGLGSHSRRHADLATLGADTLRDEVCGSHAELEGVLGQKIDCCAYPYGRLNDAVRATAAEAGYACAFSTRSGFNRTREDPLLILRIHVYGTDTAGALLRELRLGANDGARRAFARGGLAVWR